MGQLDEIDVIARDRNTEKERLGSPMQHPLDAGANCRGIEGKQRSLQSVKI